MLYLQTTDDEEFIIVVGKQMVKRVAGIKSTFENFDI